MDNFDNWIEITHGYYRYVIATKVAYEIIIHYWDQDTNILTAKASLFITGFWHNNNTGSNYFERELLIKEQPVFECIKMAVKDHQLNFS